jgi:hypothetical protein
LRHFARLLRSKEREYLYSKRFVSRFGLEPTWAFEMLAELGLPAAQQISRRATLIDARAAGDLTALLFGVVAAEVLGFGLTNSTGMTADLWTSVVGLVVVLLIVGRFWAAVTSRKTFLRNEEQFYPQVERLLELHRFDLYRSLALQPPRDADQEREVSLAEWRRGDGGPAYALGEGQVDAADNMRQQMTGLTDLLRGPELVAYEGFVSWEVRGDGVLLMFASTPLLPGGSARVEVEGSATDRYAPFELTANSQDVALVQVRAAVQAPVDGRPSQVTFDFSGQEAAKHEVPVIWIEIRQRGRFIRLLRVPLTTASARLPRSQTAAAAGDEAIHRNSDLAGAPDLPDHDRPKAPDRPDWPS